MPRPKLPDVTCRQLKPIDVWKEKDAMAERDRESQMFWHSISDDTRVAILLMVTDALTRLAARPQEWVPASIDPTAGDRLDIVISLQLPQITEAELIHKANAARLLSDTTADLFRIARELKKDPDGQQ